MLNVLDDEPKWICTSCEPAQRRMHGRGRYRKGDKKPSEEHQARNEMNFKDRWEQRKTKVRVVGPWVFGIYASPSKVRFVIVDDRKGETLLPIIFSFVEKGGTVVTKKWSGYSSLEKMKRNFVDFDTGFHTNAIERRWQEGRAYCRRARGAGRYFHFYLDKMSYWLLKKNAHGWLFVAFFLDVAKYYPSSLDRKDPTLA